MLMMWPLEFSLRWPIIAASDVDLPVPVAPTKMMRPRFVIDSVSMMGGSPSSATFGMFTSMRRSTMPIRLR